MRIRGPNVFGGAPPRLRSSSVICATTSHRFASAAKTSVFVSAVSTTFDSW
jgi:hypothetical protein